MLQVFKRDTLTVSDFGSNVRKLLRAVFNVFS